MGYEDAMESDRQMHDATTHGTEGQTYNIVREIGFLASYDVSDPVAGLQPNVPLGFEIYKQLNVEQIQTTKGRGVYNMVGALSVTPAKDYAGSRKTIYEVEEHMREVDLPKGFQGPEQTEEAALTNILFEEF